MRGQKGQQKIQLQHRSHVGDYQYNIPLLCIPVYYTPKIPRPGEASKLLARYEYCRDMGFRTFIRPQTSKYKMSIHDTLISVFFTLNRSFYDTRRRPA